MRPSPRAEWWGTFALMVMVIGLWALATPLYGSADEAAHVTHAAGLARGELTGRTVPGVTPPGVVLVELPASYKVAARRVHCFAGLENEDASCFRIRGSETATESVATDAGRHPPAYYLGVGLISRMLPTLAGAVYAMRGTTVLVTALFLTVAVHALLRARAPQLAMAGFVVALPPMVLAFSGVVNPSALEIAAALATWSCGLILVEELRQGLPPDRRLIAQLGIAASAFVLSRQISMFWLAIIALVLGGLLGANRIRRLARATTIRAWAAVLAACILVQLAWIRFARGLDLSVLPNADPARPYSEIIRTVIGRSSRLLIEMLGMPGSLDTRLPTLTYLLLIAALAALVVPAVAHAARRYMIAILVVLVTSIVVPLVLEIAQAREYGFYWQGRYTLPLALGIPLLAVLALQPETTSQFVRGRFTTALASMMLVAQLLAFYQASRRWSVGADGPILYWLDPEWTAPVPQWLLLVSYGPIYAAALVWLLVTLPARRAPVQVDDG